MIISFTTTTKTTTTTIKNIFLFSAYPSSACAGLESNPALKPAFERVNRILKYIKLNIFCYSNKI